MKVVIMTYSSAPQERKDNIEAIKKALDCSVFVGGTNYTDNIVQMLSEASDDVLMLEDDIVLCSGFKDKLEQALSTLDTSKIITFFHLGNHKEPKEMPIHLFSEMQCMYIPKDIIPLVLESVEKFKNNFAEYKLNDAQVLFRCTSKLKSYISYSPCLVQQNKFNSTIFNNWVDLQSSVFIEDIQ